MAMANCRRFWILDFGLSEAVADSHGKWKEDVGTKLECALFSVGWILRFCHYSQFGSARRDCGENNVKK